MRHVALICLLPPLLCFATAMVTDAQSTQKNNQPLGTLIRGIVVDEAGQPVAGASIQSLTFKKEDQRQTQSLRNGAFVLRIPTEGTQGQSLLVTDKTDELAGFVSEYDYTTDNRKPFTVMLRPWRTTSLSVVDNEQHPVPQAKVFLITTVGIALEETETNQRGVASLRYPANAQIDWILAYKSGQGLDYYENYDAWPSQDRLQVPEHVELKLAGAVSAIIEVRDSDDAPVPNVRVVPWTIETDGKISDINMTGLSIAHTDDDGQALFDWLPSNLNGRITFLAHDRKYHCPINPVYALNKAEVVTRTVHVQRVATVRGTVHLADGTPAAGIRLQGEGRGSTNMYFRGYAISDAQGNYEIDIYPNQDTIIAVTDDRYAAPSATEIELAPGEEKNNVDFQLTFGTLIHGQLTLGDARRPLAKETVTLIEKAGQQANLVRWNESDDAGYYHFRIGPGTYTLDLAASKEVAVTITDQSEFVHDWHLDRKPRGELSGSTLDDTGQPMAGTEVRGESTNEPGHGGFKARTGDDGTFTSERWQDDMLVYAFHAEKRQAGYKLVSADDQHVSIECEPAGSLFGRVVDVAGKPLASRRIMLQMSVIGMGGSNFWELTETDERGNYAFPAIATNMQGDISAPQALGPGQVVEFKMTKAETQELADIVVE